MKIATWNVNSLRARLPHVSRWLQEQAPDVLCLQELKAPDEDLPRAELEAVGYACAAAGQKTYNGVAVLSKAGAGDVVVGFPHLPADHALNAQRRLLAATVGGVRVVSAYLPNGEAVGSEKFAFKLAFFQELRRYLEETLEPSRPFCLCGDFNVAPEAIDVYDPKAWEGQLLCSDEERAALEGVRSVGLVDCFRLHHTEAGRYSWWDYRMKAFQRKMGLRIDHVWATPSLAERCTASDIDAEPRRWDRPSDHAPVWAEFSGF